MEETAQFSLSQTPDLTNRSSTSSLSKIAVVILLIILPVLGFYLGMKYQEEISLKTGRKTPQSTPRISVIPPSPTLIPTTAYSPSTPNPETLNWIPYKDSRYSYSFKYPPVWFLAGPQNLDGAQYVYVRFPNVGAPLEGAEAWITFETKPNTQNLSLEQWVAQNMKGQNITSSLPIKIGDVNVIKRIESSPSESEGARNLVIYAVNNKSLYHFVFLNYFNSKYQQQLDSIISTIIF